ncbi:Hemicentin-2, partial [Leptosomus discolor]
DSGTYVCHAENSAGAIRATAFVSVREAPIIQGDPSTYQVERPGGDALLDCDARGHPAPLIRWSKDGVLVVAGGRLHQLPNGSLAIRSVESTDTGRYRCVAENDAGTAGKVVTLALQREPRRVRGSLVGVINAHELGVTTLDASMLDDPRSGIATIQSSIGGIPPAVGPLMRVLVAIIAPVYWSLVHAGGEARSGFLLTRGTFRHETQLEFATGELLRVTHLAQGADAAGALLLDSVISGSVPESVGEAAVLLQDFRERYVQTGTGRLSGGSVQSFLRDGHIIRAHCNHTIVYDPPAGLQPPRVQNVRASGIKASYEPASEELRFQLHASLDAGADGDQCPVGFTLGPGQLYCVDINECLRFPPPCAFECRNLRGSYECRCPPGRTL